MSPGFLSIGLHKLALIRTILGYNVDLICSDVDTGCLPALLLTLLSPQLIP